MTAHDEGPVALAQPDEAPSVIGSSGSAVSIPQAADTTGRTTQGGSSWASGW